MDLSQLNALTGHGSSSERVATALAPKTRNNNTNVTAKDATGDSGSSSSGTDNTTITADDFLTLLVTEMKNQDPTQPTDPNEYMQQLVGVNSLQQLIQMNQGLSTFESAFEDAAGVGSGS